MNGRRVCKQREGFTGMQKNKMLLSSEILLGIRITGKYFKSTPLPIVALVLLCYFYLLLLFCLHDPHLSLSHFLSLSKLVCGAG